VVKLLFSRDPVIGIEYDSILVIIDRLTKYTYFIPYLKTNTAKDLAYIFLRIVVANHNTPEEIISDRDKLFISRFWKTFIALLRIKQKLSISFHI
jgi:hypothetical protein